MLLYYEFVAKDYCSDIDSSKLESTINSLNSSLSKSTVEKEKQTSNDTEPATNLKLKFYSYESLDPKLDRINKILSRCSLSITEINNVFSYRPRSLYDEYCRQVKLVESNINENSTQHFVLEKPVSTQTESIVTKSKGVFSVNGDEDLIWHQICKLCRSKQYNDLIRLMGNQNFDYDRLKKLPQFLYKSATILESILYEERYYRSTIYQNERLKLILNKTKTKCESTCFDDKSQQSCCTKSLLPWENRNILHMFCPINEVRIIFVFQLIVTTNFFEKV